MSEISRKLFSLRQSMRSHNISAVRLKGVDWFSWATGGGRSTVILTSEAGVAEVFVTAHKAYILTSEIEGPRLAAEEVPKDYEIVAFPWAHPFAREHFIQDHIGENSCFSDLPSSKEISLPLSMRHLKIILGPEELERYRHIGKLAAEAMTEALTQAEPTWSENELAGAGAKALWSRGLDPTLVLAGSHRRIQLYRHPIAGPEKLGDAAMMVFCARGFGLYVNLTRFIFFRPLTPQELKNFSLAAEVEVAIWQKSVPGKSLAELYLDLQEAYRQSGFPEEIQRHHQGGLTGYLSREYVVTAESPKDIRLQEGMALAWNPSFPGAKIEDTIVIGPSGLEILSVDPRWPTQQKNNFTRPDVWIKA